MSWEIEIMGWTPFVENWTSDSNNNSNSNLSSSSSGGSKRRNQAGPVDIKQPQQEPSSKPDQKSKRNFWSVNSTPW